MAAKLMEEIAKQKVKSAEEQAMAEARKAEQRAKAAQENARATSLALAEAKARAAAEAKLIAEARARVQARTPPTSATEVESRRLSATGTMPLPIRAAFPAATASTFAATQKPLFSIGRKSVDDEFLLPHELAARDRLRKAQIPGSSSALPSTPVPDPTSASQSSGQTVSTPAKTLESLSIPPKSSFIIRKSTPEDDFLLPGEMAARGRLQKANAAASSSDIGTPSPKLPSSPNFRASRSDPETFLSTKASTQKSDSEQAARLASHLASMSKNASSKLEEGQDPQSQISRFSNLINNMHSQRQKTESNDSGNGNKRETTSGQGLGSWGLLMRKRGREQGKSQSRGGQDKNQHQELRENTHHQSNERRRLDARAQSRGSPVNHAQGRTADLPKNYAYKEINSVPETSSQRKGDRDNKSGTNLEALGIVVDTSLPPDDSPEAQIQDPRKKGRKGRHNSAEEDEEDRKNDRPAKKNKKKRSDMENDRHGRQLHDEDPDAKAWSAEDEWLFEERRRRKAERKAEKEAAKKAALEAEANKVKTIYLPEFISVSALSQALSVKIQEFLDILLEYGFEDMTEDTIMTGETAALIAQEFGLEAEVDDGQARDVRARPPPEDISALPPRAPVVTIMGHVDHGKTTLLDWLRQSSIAAQEHGGITQHIGAFVVKMKSGKQITFLDTPGHAAFLSMRKRGANATDIIILVVAADDSVKPQTLEALKHAREAQVPIIVAITKCDKPNARIDVVKNDLSRHEIEIEDYGGDVQVVPVSGKTGQGMDLLEENIITLAEMLDMRAELDGMVEGWVLEANIKSVGKAATVLVKRGTLRVGDCIVAGHTWARVRALRDEAGQELKEAGPGTPVEILGWRDLPQAGDQIIQAPDEAKARTAVNYRMEMREREEGQSQLAESERKKKEALVADEAKKAADENGEDAGEEEKGPQIVNFIVRGDVVGSVEAVSATILEIGNHEVQPRILRQAAGNISESDVEYAAISGSIIISFNNPSLGHIKRLASEQGVRIVEHSVIYTVADDVKTILSKKLDDKITYRVIGEAEVSKVFSINVKRRIYRNIAGCKVRNGIFKRNDLVRIFRKKELLYEGKMSELKHGKRDVMEMRVGTECGVSFEDFQDFEAGDIIQTCEEVRTKRSL
ncbi:Translation initiation factor IF-2 [Ceratocystis fimbriata CBS 114723]|uniref:Translation initiation factor IF-2, mitochondrial n=1 Tax=Ceratocystis fimbriata CBS 114723 TaxID=1035309 RepID=A0A2C5WJS6_9PEZI|nr:Translation initiation factor IF-2 [Ceratocystis fimbriata CBS 114723]